MNPHLMMWMRSQCLSLLAVSTLQDVVFGFLLLTLFFFFSSGRPTTAQTSLTLIDAEDDEPSFNSAGTLNTPSASRARMLAQQRELQLKKRQTSVQTSGKSPLLLKLLPFPP